jgi:1-acyl-sn-glycerol-3-phosphate acyltransferase
MSSVAPKTTEYTDWRDQLTWYTHETTFIRIVKRVGGIPFRLMAYVERVDFDNLPSEGPCILVANHINDLDVIYLGLSLPRHPYFMAKIELYKIPLFGWAIRLGGSFPVIRGEQDTWALKQAGRVLEASKMLLVFPEGTRSGRQAQLKRGKVGAVKLALAHQVPIVPAAVFGTQNFRIRLGHANKIRIQIGKPIDVVAMAGLPPYEHKTLRELTTILMKKIAAMLPTTHRGVYV